MAGMSEKKPASMTLKVDGVEHRILNEAELYAVELFATIEKLAASEREVAKLRQRAAELEAEKAQHRLSELRERHGLPQAFSWRTVGGVTTLRDDTPKVKDGPPPAGTTGAPPAPSA
jgi:hypothetical protein